MLEEKIEIEDEISELELKRKSRKPEKKPKHTSVKSNFYVNPAELLAEFHECKKTGVLSDKMAGFLMLIAKKYSFHPWFIRFSYREEMVSTAIAVLVQNWHKFNPEKSSNIFSYYTTTCYRAYQSYRGYEDDEQNIKQQMLSNAGRATSFNYQNKTSGSSHDDHAFMNSGPEEH